METCFLNDRCLPVVIEPGVGDGADHCPDALIDFCLGHKEVLRDRLLERGALLFRGQYAFGPADFARFVREFSGKRLIDYTGGASPRVKLGEGVYTSTEYPKSCTLSLHNELSYTFRWPDHLFFYCMAPADEGGETSLGNSRAILKGIEESVVRTFRDKQIRYVRNLHGGAGSGYSWQEAFETDNRETVEEHCNSGGMDFKWRSDGGLRLSEVRPATAFHPVTGEEVWFNQADGFHPSGLDPETYNQLISQTNEDEFRLNSYYGDGTKIELQALNTVREVMRKESALLSWKAGDILILDNLLTAHGRMPFSGARKILLAMT